MLKSRVLLFTLIIALLVIPTLGQTPNQQASEENTIKINTDLVNLDIQVLDKKTGNPKNGLTLGNFEIYENGVKQNISNFSQDKLPLSVLILLDVSGSVEEISPQLKDATIKALNLLKPEDEVSLMAFASGTGAIDAFTKNKQVIIDNIEKVRLKTVPLGQGTKFNEAASDAISHIKKNANSNYRKVIIAITDNILSKPLAHQKEKVIVNLLESGISMSALLVEDFAINSPILSAKINGSRSPGRGGLIEVPPGSTTEVRPRAVQGGSTKGLGNTNRRNTNATPNVRIAPETNPNTSPTPGIDIIDEYVDQTGGEIIDARRASVEEKFVELIEHLRARYSVGYVSSNTKDDSKLRKIKIKLITNGKEIDDVAVKTRKGYFAFKDK